MNSKKLQAPVRNCMREVKTTVYVDLSIGRAITHLRRKHIDENVVYIYVVDHDDILLGVVRIRDLLLRDPKMSIRDILDTKLITVHENQTLHEALITMEKHHLLAMPVVNERNKLLGVLDIRYYFEEAVDVDTSKKRWQLFQTLGLILDSKGKRISTLRNYSRRMPWILCNMVGGLLCAVISDLYEVVLAKVIILAMFIPLVLSLSESISMQAMTQSILDIGKHFSFWRQSMRYLFQESKLFSLLAITSGIIVGIFSLLWGEGWGPSIVITCSIMVSVTITAFIGALIPLMIHTWKLDPKIASGPIVLMLADVITTTIYLSLGFWWLL